MATGKPSKRDLSEQLVQEKETNLVLTESILDLERQLHDPEWIRLVNLTEIEFAPESLVRLRSICRVFAIKNPLIKRGLALRSAYVWGQGVEIQARANSRREKPGEQDVNKVLQDFLTADGNVRTLTGPEARDRLERSLGTDGEYFIGLWTRPLTGQVQARIINADEIHDVVTNPEDSSEPWFYRRRWYVSTVNPANGVTERKYEQKLYPAVGYRPRVRPARFGDVPVGWDSPLIHVKVNDLSGWKHGIPDAYAAIDWANAYKNFLEDWARLMRALSRFAWRFTAKGSAQAQARKAIAAGPSVDRITGTPNQAGATAMLPPDAILEAIPKTGAQIDAESGRPLAMMVASALGVPVTMLLADPGQTGARATAETLDQPTELELGQRRELHTGVTRRISEYVITEAVRAPQGPLKGTITQDPFTGRETVALAGDTDTTIDVTWPDLDDVDPFVLMQAIEKANATGTVKPEEILRLTLTALGVRNVDDLIDAQMDDQGNFIWPSTGPTPEPGPADAARAGLDPAGAGTGSMVPGDPAGTGQLQQDPVGNPAEGG
jgi:hypothetical protein